MTTCQKFTRRGLIVAGAAIPLAGCGQTLFGVPLEQWGNAVEVATGIKDQPTITLDDAAKIPYSTLGYQFGSGAEDILILASNTGGDLLWTSSVHRTLVTRSGRVIKCQRFDWNLDATQFFDSDPLTTNQKVAAERRFTRACDFRDIDRFAIEIESEFQQKGPETITILGQPLATMAFVENCRAKQLEWEFQNMFWVDQDSGFVWRSQQTIHPNLDPLTIEILRPPG
jgi:hypothetical protein